MTVSELRGSRRRPAELLHVLLRQGRAPRQLAATIALGVALGTIPILWGTTFVCLGAALTLRLNFIALQAVNLLCWPLHLVLLYPFFRLGQKLFPGGADLPAAEAMLRAPLAAMSSLGGASLRAVGAWAVLAPPVCLLLYILLRCGLCRNRS